MTNVPSRLKAALADRYTIERELGRGGMATVYLAEDLKLHRKVAVKVLRPELAAALGPDRFLQEIDIAAKLTHPHILGLHGCGEADGFFQKGDFAHPIIPDRDTRSHHLPLPADQLSTTDGTPSPLVTKRRSGAAIHCAQGRIAPL